MAKLCHKKMGMLAVFVDGKTKVGNVGDVTARCGLSVDKCATTTVYKRSLQQIILASQCFINKYKSRRCSVHECVSVDELVFLRQSAGDN